MTHFVYMVTYLGKMLVIEREISSLMITWLFILKKSVVDSFNNEAIIQQFQNMKNLQKKILKLYVFAIGFLCQCIQVLFY